MALVTWTPAASEDLEAIRQFIARDSVPASDTFEEAVLDATERLQDFPYSGRIVPEIRMAHLREVIVGNYRVIYSVAEEKVDILVVQHGARRLPDLRS